MLKNNSQKYFCFSLILLFISLSHAEEVSIKRVFPLDKHYSYDDFIQDKKRAETGNAESQYFMGIVYEHQVGNFFKKNNCKAFEWYKKASEQGHIDSSYRLGVMYQEGSCIKIDLEKAKKLFEFAAEKGSVVAQYSLGRLYYNGNGVSKDYSTALRWFEKADKKDYFIATYAIGMAYKMGNGVEKDDKKAFEWFLRSANLGYRDGMSIVALMYQFGYGVDKDINKAIFWYQKAVEKESTKALNDLAWLLSTCPQKKYRDGETAVFLSNFLIKVGGETPEYLGTLAAAYAENNDFKNAIKWQAIAIDKINNTKQKKYIKQNMERLEFYKQKKSWIDK